MKKTTLLICVLLLIKVEVSAQKNITVMFYNVENFFDTKDNPATSDEEYLPGSELNWDEKKYANKIKRTAEVIDSTVTGAALPDIVGFCEIENVQVINDLISKSQLKSRSYQSLCTTGKDDRGINVGFMFDKALFELVSSEELNAIDPSSPTKKTRNILFVILKFKPTSEQVCVFVNHWPSRRDGEKESESRRIYAAQVVRNKINELQKKNSNCKVIVMGDLNDTPENKSILTTLMANGNPKKGSSELLNPYFQFEKNGMGTHYDRGNWSVFDNIIVSQSFTTATGLYYKAGNAFILKKDFVLFKNNKTGEEKPNRTYGNGNKYFNGYSDHLAVYVKLNY